MLDVPESGIKPVSPAMAGGFFNTDPPGKPQVMILNFVVAAYFIYSVDSGELWASLIAQLVKNRPTMQEARFNSWVGKICWRRDRLPTPVFLGFPCGSAHKESACTVGDLGSYPGLGRSPEEGKSYPLQYSGLENSVHGVAESDTTERLFTFW